MTSLPLEADKSVSLGVLCVISPSFLCPNHATSKVIFSVSDNLAVESRLSNGSKEIKMFKLQTVLKKVVTVTGSSRLASIQHPHHQSSV